MKDEETKTCSICNETKANVVLRHNPYTNELYYDEELYLICDDCEHQLCMDIKIKIS